MGLTKQERQDRLWDRAIKIKKEHDKERAFKAMLATLKEALADLAFDEGYWRTSNDIKKAINQAEAVDHG